MRLIIAEKPSVAKAIASVLGSGRSSNGFIQCGNTTVTWCVGHLLEQAPPEHYDPALKRWDVSALPIRVTKWALLPKPATASQIKVIGSLLSSATEVVNAGDPDREGQLLVDEVLEHLHWNGVTKRLLVNATDDGSVKKALAKIEDNAKYRPLMLSALCRQRADWLVGMNLSRATTKLLSQEATISIGRVQTPTLALVVRRQHEIDNFKSEAFYTFEGSFALESKRTITMRCEPDPRISNDGVAHAVSRAITGKVTKLKVEVTKASRFAPLPFDLAEFQKLGESLFGWSASKSLEILQASYEAKLTSYPRTDCRYLPEEQKADASPLAKKIAADLNIAPRLVDIMQPSPRIYDNKKVAEHHGLAPTGIKPSASTPDDVVKAWRLVSLQFLSSLLPDEKYEETRVSALVHAGGKTIDEMTFGVRGERKLNANDNWTAINLRAAFGKASDTKAEVILPAIKDGEAAQLTKCLVNEGKTTPPKPYTESSLIADMRSVAKYVSDPKLKAILKETSGIGTAATQASILERLKTMGYLLVEKKYLKPSELGMQIIDCIPPEMADPGITAAWEDALGMIAKSAYDPDVFMQRVDRLIVTQIERIQRRRGEGARIKAAKPAPSARKSSSKTTRRSPSGTAPSPGSKTSDRSPARTARQ